jgi:HPt (histidine-containing phosphotransfer) domain-containing protein
MDHMMPKMNGMETTKILRSMGYSQPVVALTANAITGSSEMFLSNGFDGYMSKPIDMRELNASLNRLIRDKQPPEIIEASRKEVEQRKMAAVPELVRKVLTNEKLVAAVVRDIGNAISVLEDITSKINNSGEADIELYTTTIHGMKSALANIGETELSSAAFKLEQAGDKGEINIISAETPNFIRELMLLVKKFKPEQPKDSKNPEETADDKNMLREKLSDIIKACGKFNKKAAKTALDDLKASARTRAANDLLDEISVYLLRGEFKKVVEAAEKAIAQI